MELLRKAGLRHFRAEIVVGTEPRAICPGLQEHPTRGAHGQAK